MTPKFFLKLRKRQQFIIDICNTTIASGYELAKECPLPQRLRQATPEDITVGQILWYDDKYWTGWKAVEEVLHPSDRWKAYVAEDGCRYGLDGAMIELDK